MYRSRPEGNLEEKALNFLSSINDDYTILQYDILGSQAHSIMLYEIDILTKQELKSILNVLEEARLGPDKIRTEGFEDIHEALEGYAISKAGIETAGKIHTGRSRNDQVALDIRMKIRDDLNTLCSALIHLLSTLISIAKKNTRTIMVMYTHLQQAQIGTFGHYLVSYADVLTRDLERLSSCYTRMNLSPLGACAIGGSSIPLDRFRTAGLLGFDGIVNNSIDATSSRDVLLEYASDLAILMTNLSRIAEDLILWSTTEFGFVALSDHYSSTSSAMPQKKNPDPLELTRSKASRVMGDLVGLLSMVKALPSGYSRDLQDVKPSLFHASSTTLLTVQILTEIMNSISIQSEKMCEGAAKSYAIALDLAEQLVIREKVPFRVAHKVIGSLVKTAAARGVPLDQLSIDDIRSNPASTLQGMSDEGLLELLKDMTVKRSLAERKTLGSPNPSAQTRAIANLKNRTAAQARILHRRTLRVHKAFSNLDALVRKLQVA